MAERPIVYLVGAGPGDPDLLTVKAARLLQQAEVVVYDRLVPDAIMRIVPRGTMRIYVGKAPKQHPMPQSEINALLLRLAEAGHKVVRLKGGDPFVFGRGSEEAEHLARHGIRFEVVPGITAAAGCTAAAGIPLTHRGLATGVRIVTGHCRDDIEPGFDWRGLADPDTTLVIYMGLANLPRIAAELQAAGLSGATPAAAIARGTTPDQRCCITTLADLPDRVTAEALPTPVLMVIGRVVTLAGLLRPDAAADQTRIDEPEAHERVSFA